MTGLEKMVSQILEEADASAAVMISDAEKKAAEILGEAGEKADKIRQQREEQSRAKVKSSEERTASAADMRKRTAVLAAKQELIGKVIADACDRVKNLDEGKYFEILKSMAEKYRQHRRPGFRPWKVQGMLPAVRKYPGYQEEAEEAEPWQICQDLLLQRLLLHGRLYQRRWRNLYLQELRKLLLPIMPKRYHS